MLNKKLLLVLPLFLVFLSFCAEDEPEGPASIVDTAIATPELSSLVAALTEANLVSAVSGTSPQTVFAPNNAAFQALLDSDPTWNTLEDIPDALLENVLKFHVLNGKVEAADLSDTYVNTLATGPNSEALSLQVNVTGGVTFNGSAEPIATDVQASNGVVHIIDRVMLPPGLPTLATNNPNFTSLVGALLDTRHTTNYLAILSDVGPYTVFAPTNAAFQALLDTDPTWNSTADIPIGLLEAVLNYHVVASANVQSDELSVGQEIVMFSGDTLTVSGATTLTASGSTTDINIIIPDVQGTNGVVHAIDAVLLP